MKRVVQSSQRLLNQTLGLLRVRHDLDLRMSIWGVGVQFAEENKLAVAALGGLFFNQTTGEAYGRRTGESGDMAGI